MTQLILKEKFVQFLKLTHPQGAMQFDTILGVCYGLSICHASMKLINKLIWWEEALKALINWSGNPQDLNKKIPLPQQEQLDTLGGLFNRIFNYVVYYQQGFILAPKNSCTLLKHQMELLNPKAELYEILTPEKAILQIKDRELISGQFSQEALNNLLDDKTIQRSLFIVSNHEHAISIEYDELNKLWMVYDPDYNHQVSVEKPIYQSFKNKSALITEIFSIIGTTLSLEKATFKANPKKRMTHFFSLMTQSNPQIILKEIGFVMMYSPELVVNLINYLETKYTPKALARLMLKCLCEEYEIPFKDHGLFFIARHAPSLVDKMLTLAEKDPSFNKRISRPLITKGVDGLTGLHKIIKYVPHLLPRVIDYLMNTHRGVILFSQALCSHDLNTLETAWQNMQPFISSTLKKKIQNTLLKEAKHIPSRLFLALVPYLHDAPTPIKYDSRSLRWRMTNCFFNKYRVPENKFLKQFISAHELTHPAKSYSQN